MDTALLHGIAMKCVELNAYGECDEQCAKCQFNVFNYNIEIGTATLIKADSLATFMNRAKQKKEDMINKCGMQLAPLMFITIIGVIIFILFKGCAL
jgi:hypothetical protein